MQKLSTAAQALSRVNKRDTAPFARSSSAQRPQTGERRIEDFGEFQDGSVVERQSLKSIAIFPVSYTHLDVYKRQGEAR